MQNCSRNQVLPISGETTGARVTMMNTARNSTHYIEEDSHVFTKADADDGQISKIDEYDYECDQVSIENEQLEDFATNGRNLMDHDLMQTIDTNKISGSANEEEDGGT